MNLDIIKWLLEEPSPSCFLPSQKGRAGAVYNSGAVGMEVTNITPTPAGC